MSNPQKIKGSNFERMAVEILNTLIKNSKWNRVPGSGAIGTSLNEPALTSDIVGKVDSIPRKFKVECKVGYGGATQFTLKKEWIDKIKQEAIASHSFPFLMGKFLGAREGTKVFVVMDVDEFASIINHITRLQEELNEANNLLATAYISQEVSITNKYLSEKVITEANNIRDSGEN